MRPLKVTISAWGPYKDKVIVDFTKFKKGSLFLITGPTGAGKTTVFDAISFALFGDVSGKTREKGSLRSDFATAKEDTYVELLFEHKDKVYRIFRAPKYERPKKRGEGTTTSMESAELYIENDPPIAIISEVNRRVEQILGLSYSQYKQISMIAQGEFLELLVANSKDRVEILRNIFRTNSYDKLQKMLSDKANQLERELKELNSRLEEIASTVVLKEEDGEPASNTLSNNYDGMLERLKGELAGSQKEIQALKQQIEKLEEEEKQWVEKITKAKKRKEDVTKLEQTENELSVLMQAKEEVEEKKAKLAKAVQAKNVEQYDKVYAASVEQYKAAKEKLEQITIELKQIEPVLQEKQAEFEKIKDLEAKVLALQEKKQKLEYYLPIIQELKQLRASLDETTQLSKKSEENLKELTEKITSLDKMLGEKQETYKQYESIEIRIENHKLLLNQNESKREKMQEIMQLNQSLMQTEETKKDYVKQLTDLEKGYLSDKANYEDMELRYKRAIIGIVARDLVDGSPCPVCGSLSHPVKAKISKEAPDEKEVEQYKKKAEQSQKLYQEAYSLVAAIQEKVANLEKDIKQKCKAFSCEIESIDKLWEDLGNEKKELELSKKDLLLKQTQKQEIEKQIESLKQKQEKSKEAYHEEEKNSSLLKQSIEDLHKQYENKQKDLPEQYRESQQIESMLVVVKKEMTETQDRIHTVRAEYEKAHTNRERLVALKEERQEEMRRLFERSGQEKEELQKALQTNGFSSFEEYHASCLNQQQKSQLESDIKDYERNCQEKTLLKQTLMETIKSEEVFDLSELLEKQGIAAEQKKELQGNLQDRITIQTVNDRAYHQLKERLSKKALQEKSYGIVKKLDNLAKGNNPDRLVFEQYVLASYFEEILSAANLRLREMSNNRYELMRSNTVSDARKKDSLDIEVLDHYTGKKRSVKSLSGGESFKAALSLALGMADIVQNYAGGIEIDTLFIDEGFGSLDVESLEQALDTLSSLTERDRLIGIISHVNELKERINNQIVVDRGKQGSTLEMKTI